MGHSDPTASATRGHRTESDICEWCVAYLAKTFELSPQTIDPHGKFARLGMDSAGAIFFVGELEEWLGIELGTEVVFEYPTPIALARYIAGHCAATNHLGRQGD